jgi:hypothetical protein
MQTISFRIGRFLPASILEPMTNLTQGTTDILIGKAICGSLEIYQSLALKPVL